MKHVRILLISAFLILTMLSAFRASEQGRLRYSSVSLRYEQTLSSELVAAAKSQMEQTGGLNLTFWAEEKNTVSSALRGKEATQIRFDGDAMLACPAEYRYGRSPVTSEECAVSNTLAESLWGAENVIGLELMISEGKYTVTGVFLEQDALVLTPGTAEWTCVELHSVPAREDGWRYGRDYAAQLGLPQPDQVLWGSGFAWILSVLPWLPLFVCGCAGLFYALRLLWRRSHTALVFALTGLAFAFVLLLPLILSGLPAWLIPTKWSDFSFWTQLFDVLAARFRDFLSLSPKSIDIARKTYLLKTTLYSAVSLLLSASLFRRYSNVRSQYDQEESDQSSASPIR